MPKSKNWNNGKNTGNFSKFEKSNIQVLGNVIKEAHAKFPEASSIGNTQIWRGTINDVNISKSKNWKNGLNSGHFSKFEKLKITVLENVIRKAHAKISVILHIFSIGNIQKSRGTAGEILNVDEDSYPYVKNLGYKFKML